MNMFEGIMQGLDEALKYVQGEGRAKKSTVYIYDEPKEYSADMIKEVRKNASLTQRNSRSILVFHRKR